MYHTVCTLRCVCAHAHVHSHTMAKPHPVRGGLVPCRELHRFTRRPATPSSPLASLKGSPLMPTLYWVIIYQRGNNDHGFKWPANLPLSVKTLSICPSSYMRVTFVIEQTCDYLILSSWIYSSGRLTVEIYCAQLNWANHVHFAPASDFVVWGLMSE